MVSLTSNAGVVPLADFMLTSIKTTRKINAQLSAGLRVCTMKNDLFVNLIDTFLCLVDFITHLLELNQEHSR